MAQVRRFTKPNANTFADNVVNAVNLAIEANKAAQAVNFSTVVREEIKRSEEKMDVILEAIQEVLADITVKRKKGMRTDELQIELGSLRRRQKRLEIMAGFIKELDEMLRWGRDGTQGNELRKCEKLEARKREIKVKLAEVK